MSKTLKERLAQAQDDSFLRTRTFSQGLEEQPKLASNIAEQEAIKYVKERISAHFGQRILNENKSNSFRFEMLQAIERLLSEQLGGNIAKSKLLAQKVMDDILGFGPIQALLEDPEVTEIMVVAWNKIYAEKKGRLQLIPNIYFDNEEHLRNVIDKIVQPIGRRIDESEPLVDARLPDGSRVNATIPPISPEGSTLTIRKFAKHKLTGQDYLNFGSLDERMLKFLELAVKARCNIIVSGGTGSGKTTLLNMLSNFVPPHESIVTVEDSLELQLYQDNVRRLEARPANMEGKGEISIRRLVKNTLRMRPDRIIVGEIRDGSVVDMFRAMSSGHDGSLTTIHANNPRDLIESVLPILFGMSDMSLTEDAIRRQIALSVDLVVQIARLRDGSRKITHITHVVGLGRDGANKLKNVKEVDPNKIYLQHIYSFVPNGISGDGKVLGAFISHGYEPKNIITKAQAQGLDIPAGLFEQGED